MQRQALALFERLQDFGPALASGAVSRKHAETAAADGREIRHELRVAECSHKSLKSRVFNVVGNERDSTAAAARPCELGAQIVGRSTSRRADLLEGRVRDAERDEVSMVLVDQNLRERQSS